MSHIISDIVICGLTRQVTPPMPEKTNSQSHASMNIDAIRGRIADGALIAVSFIAVPALTMSLLRIQDIGWQPAMAVQIVAAVIVWFVTIFRQKLTSTVRSGVVTGLMFAIGVAAFFTQATGGAGQGFLILSIVLAAVLLGTRSSLTILALGGFAIATTGFLFTSQSIGLRIDLNAYNVLSRAWLTAFFGFLFLGGTAIATIVGLNKILIQSVSKLAQQGQRLEVEVANQTRSLEERIAQHEQTEILLRMSEERFRDFATAAADRYWETDENHRFLYVSETAAETNRFEASSMTGKTRWEIDEISPDAPHWQEYRALMDSHEPFTDFEYTRLRADGTEFYIRTSAIPMTDARGNFSGYRGINREISREVTAKRAAEAQAQLAQQRLFDAMEQMDVGFVLWDPETRFVDCNSYFRELQGPNRAFLTPGIEYADFLAHVAESREIGPSEDDKDAWWQDRLTEINDESNDLEYPINDGRWIRARRRELPDGSMIGLHTDVTDRRNLDQMKDEFVSIASHELRTPLTSIVGAIGLIKSGAAGEISEKTKELIDIAQLNSERLVGLVSDFLDLRKMEAGETTLDPQSIDVMPLVEDAVKLNASYAEQFGCTYMIKEHLPGARIFGDADALHQVLANLLSNAAKYSPKDGRVEISVTRDQQNIRVAVADRGPGIPVNFRDKIFERFTQADSTDTRSRAGTGLGLSIAQKIIELHYGEIKFDTELGHGTTFYFELPEHNAPDPAPSR